MDRDHQLNIVHLPACPEAQPYMGDCIASYHYNKLLPQPAFVDPKVATWVYMMHAPHPAPYTPTHTLHLVSPHSTICALRRHLLPS